MFRRAVILVAVASKSPTLCRCAEMHADSDRRQVKHSGVNEKMPGPREPPNQSTRTLLSNPVRYRQFPTLGRGRHIDTNSSGSGGSAQRTVPAGVGAPGNIHVARRFVGFFQE